MESSFRGGRHAHTCAGCLHWAGKLHADAFQHSWWAHQIRILVFTLDFSLPKYAHICGLCLHSYNLIWIYLFLFYFFVQKFALLYNIFCLCHFHATLYLWHFSECWVTCSPHPFSVSKQLTQLMSSPQKAEGLPTLQQSKFTRKWNPLYAKQTMRRK